MFRIILAGCALAITATAAAAQPETAARTMVCVDVSGRLLAAECRGQPGRLRSREDICLCPRGQRVEAEVCPSGVAPAPESLAADRARKQALHGSPSLVGASFEGRPLCVAGRQP
jgi:hypothetical protein